MDFLLFLIFILGQIGFLIIFFSIELGGYLLYVVFFILYNINYLTLLNNDLEIGFSNYHFLILLLPAILSIIICIIYLERETFIISEILSFLLSNIRKFFFTRISKVKRRKQLNQLIYNLYKKRITKNNVVEITILLIQCMNKNIMTLAAIEYGEALEYIYHKYSKKNSEIKNAIEKFEGLCLYDDYEPEKGGWETQSIGYPVYFDGGNGSYGWESYEEPVYVVYKEERGRRVCLELYF